MENHFYKKMSIFVTVGNSKKNFSRLLHEIVKLRPYLCGAVVVQHGHTLFDFEGFTSYSFLDEKEFLFYIKESDLIISHAGVGTIISAHNLNKNIIIVPRQLKYKEHINDHQMELAKYIESNGLGSVVYEIDRLKNFITKKHKNNSDYGYSYSGKDYMVNLIKEKLESIQNKVIKC